MLSGAPLFPFLSFFLSFIFFFPSLFLPYTPCTFVITTPVQSIVLCRCSIFVLLYLFTNPSTSLPAIDILLPVSVYTVSLFAVLSCLSACMYFYPYPSEFFLWRDELGYIATIILHATCFRASPPLLMVSSGFGAISANHNVWTQPCPLWFTQRK